MQVALDSLSRFRYILGDYQWEALRVVATNTLRVAKNAAEFLSLAEQAIGYPIEIISGEEEVRLIYMGGASMLRLPNEKRLVLDIGGGSTELILGRWQQIERVESFGIGTVNQSLTFLPTARLPLPPTMLQCCPQAVILTPIPAAELEPCLRLFRHHPGYCRDDREKWSGRPSPVLYHS